MHLRPILTGDNPPIPHVTACSVAFLDSCLAGGCSSREGRQRQALGTQHAGTYVFTNSICIAREYTTWRMKGRQWLKTCPSCNCQATAGPHNDSFQSGAVLDQHLHLTPLMAPASCMAPAQPPSVSLSTRNGEDEKEHRPRVPAFLCPASERSFLPFLPSNSHPRIIYLQVVRLPK